MYDLIEAESYQAMSTVYPGLQETVVFAASNFSLSPPPAVEQTPHAPAATSAGSEMSNQTFNRFCSRESM